MSATSPEMIYAVTDIETTGGSISHGRITEVAIVLTDGVKILDRFSTLVNPEQLIPPNISHLTDISNEMVAGAPLFQEIIPQIEAFTKGAIFVAHNVNFDYGFIRESYNRAGERFQRKKLCTVRLSRKIIPGYPSYSLGRLCEQVGIPLKNRHRALGDADATALLLQLLIKNDVKQFIAESLKPTSKEAILPPHLDKNKFEVIPNEMGVYHFFDQKGKVIYVGKAVDLKKRIRSHFLGNTNTKSKLNFAENIYDVQVILCSNELIMNLTEAHSIKKHWPIHNRAMKKVTLNYGLYQYKDQNGYNRFTMGRSGKNDRPLISFRSAHESRKYLEDLCQKYNLCPKLCSLQTPSVGSCYHFEHEECNGACIEEESALDYNTRFEEAITEVNRENNSFIICGKGKTPDLKSIVVVQKGRYKGFGEAPIEMNITSIDTAINHIQYGYDDQDIQVLISAYIRKCDISELVPLTESTASPNSSIEILFEF